jgi:hypothetical protein
MRSKEALAYLRGTGYFCTLASDHSAPFRRVTPRRAGAGHDATGMERHDKDGPGGDGGKKNAWLLIDVIDVVVDHHSHDG